MMMRVLVVGVLVAGGAWGQAPVERVGGRIDLPSSKQIVGVVPGGPQQLGSLPVSMAVSPDGRYVVTVNDGYGSYESKYAQSLAVLDTRTGKVVDYPDLRTVGAAPEVLFSGLAFSSDGTKLYGTVASLTDPEGKEGTGSGVQVYSFRDGVIGRERVLKIAPARLASGKATRLGTNPSVGVPYPAAVAVVSSGCTKAQPCEDHNFEVILVADNLSDDVLEMDVRTGQVVTRFDLSDNSVVPSAYPIDVRVSRDGRRGYVALWNASEVVELDLVKGVVGRRLTLLKGREATSPGSHPVALEMAPEGKTMYVALSNRDAVAAVDLSDGRFALKGYFDTRLPGQSFYGAQPESLALSADGSRLYVADMGADAVAVIDTKKLTKGAVAKGMVEPEGFVPTEWLPMGVAVTGGRLYVTTGKGMGTGPNNFAQRATEETKNNKAFLRAFSYIPTLLHGSVAVVDEAMVERELKGFTAATLENNRMKAAAERIEFRPEFMGGGAAAATADSSASLRNDKQERATTTATTEVLRFAQNDNKEQTATSANAGPSTSLRSAQDDTRAGVLRSAQDDARAGVLRSAQDYTAQGGSRSGRGPIRHVIYIIRENRTYDQILGDLVQDGKAVGNGDKSLTMYGQEVTPNFHKLALQFGVLDNFYDSAEVSGDGHVWSNAGIGTDYLERTWQLDYRGKQRGYDYEGVVSEGIPLEQGIADVNEPASGYIWGDVAKHGLTLMHFGEYISSVFCTDKGVSARQVDPTQGPLLEGKACSRTSVKPGEKLPEVWGGGVNKWAWAIPLVASNTATKPELVGHFAAEYPDFNLLVPDQVRFGIFERHFKEWVEERKAGKDEMPNFVMLRIANDHTAGTRVGSPTPKASIADNDLAIGRVVEAISHSAYWEDTAIFVLEDDAQNGADHVDAHRSVALVVSKYAPRAADGGTFVDSRFYSTVSMVRTMEAVLGLPPMNNNDALSSMMGKEFSGAGDQAAFVADRSNEVNGLIYTANQATAPGAKQSEKMDFRHADRADARKLNVILWQDAMGTKPVPASLLVKRKKKKDDDD